MGEGLLYGKSSGGRGGNLRWGEVYSMTPEHFRIHDLSLGL